MLPSVVTIKASSVQSVIAMKTDGTHFRHPAFGGNHVRPAPWAPAFAGVTSGSPAVTPDPVEGMLSFPYVAWHGHGDSGAGRNPESRSRRMR